MNFREKSVMLLATGCFSGKIPFAPGTFGSMVGLPICFFLSKINASIAILCIVLFIFFAIWVAQDAESILKKKDPGCIVIDEIAGMMVTFAVQPFTLISASAGFFIFRVLDIVKPFPVRTLEKNLSGGAGIVLDDVAAGIYSNLALRALFLTIDPN